MGKIISVVNQKGGVGKSGVCVNLGIGIVKTGKKVLLIDADPQGDMSACLGYRGMDNEEDTLADLIHAVMNDLTLPKDLFIRHHPEGVDVITSNIELAGEEMQLVNTIGREYILKQIIKPVIENYDYIFIDNMPSLGMLTINTLAAADEVLIPVEAMYLPLKGLQMLLRTIGKVKRQINPQLQICGIVLNKVDMRTNEAKENIKLLRKTYGQDIKIFENYIPMSVRASECGKEGKSIYAYDPRGKVAEAYECLAKEVLIHDGQ